MCGRIVLTTSQLNNLNRFLAQWGTTQHDDVPRYNVPPTTDIWVVRRSPEANNRELLQMRWGLIPSWTKDPKKSPLNNNARAETVAEKPSFRSAYKSRRCIIPVTGFYEWKTEGKHKQPYYFHRPDGQDLAFAGLWESWNNIESCTIITCDANVVMAPVHHRMPVILGDNDHSEWLDPAATDVSGLMTPCPADEVTCYPVGPFNNVRN